MKMLNCDDRVRLRHGEEFVKTDGTPVIVPSGHEGVIVEMSEFAASCQSRWAYARVLLDPIGGVAYTLKIEPAYLDRVEVSEVVELPTGDKQEANK